MVRRVPLLLAALLVFAAALSGTAGGREAAKPARKLRPQLLGHANPGGGYWGDVYYKSGYAYLSSWSGPRCPAIGVHVIDVRNPRRPREVSTFADADSDPALEHTWTEKTIVKRVATPFFRGDLAVTSVQRCGAGEGVHGFALYDVTNPARPRRLALVQTEPRGSHEIWLATRGSKAYVYTAIPYSELESSPTYDKARRSATVPGKPDFRIFDVTEPQHPVEVGGWGAWRTLGIYPRNGRGSFEFNFVHSVRTNAAATRAYLSYWDLGTVILDISNPARPRYLGRTGAHDAEGDTHSSWLMRNGKILVETHENAIGRPYFYDISNPRRPRLLSRFGPVGDGSGGFSSGVHDPKILGSRGYFSWYRRGVLVADVSNPRRPRLVAQFKPPATRDERGSICDRCFQIWGVYPTRSFVLASDMVGGLWVFRLR